MLTAKYAASIRRGIEAARQVPDTDAETVEHMLAILGGPVGHDKLAQSAYLQTLSNDSLRHFLND